ncbi:unknown [Clostridium sp. CAG:967]|nr:unknown [Clostridium sp. CAG:967]
MREQILKLCRRLDKFTIDNLLMITEMETEELMPIVRELLTEGKLSESNGQYSYCKKVFVMSKYSIFSFYNSNIIDTVIRSFCSGIPAYITSQIAGIGKDQTAKFYDIFRAELYEKQTKKLKSFYLQKPKIARNRMFFDTELHFYIYGNQVFVSDELLESENAEFLNKLENKEFKKIYSYLTRCAFHNQTKHHLPQKLNEFLWRRNKDFEQLYFELKILLGGKYET